MPKKKKDSNETILTKETKLTQNDFILNNNNFNNAIKCSEKNMENSKNSTEINNTRLDKIENDIASLKELILESRKNDAIR